VVDTGREVTGLANARRKGGADQRQRLFLDDRDQPVPHDLHGDIGMAHGVVSRMAAGVAAAGASTWRRRSMQPSGCMMAVKPAGTMTVVSRSVTMAGPASDWPDPKLSRRIDAASVWAAEAAS